MQRTTKTVMRLCINYPPIDGLDLTLHISSTTHSQVLCQGRTNIFNRLSSKLLRPEEKDEVGLGMIGFYTQVGKQKLLTAWFAASTLWLGGHKYRIDLMKRLHVLPLHNPTLFGCVIDIENPQAHGLCNVRASPPPHLKRAGVVKAWLPV